VGNNDFGKGGRDTFIKEMAARNIKVTVMPTESGQAASADVVKIKAANADAIFVYVNEEESARSPPRSKEAGHQDLAYRRDHLTRPKGDRSGSKAQVCGHVGLTVDAPIPAVKEFAERFEAPNYVCDHNGIKGYTCRVLYQACH
jgi:branched-chain amino acid transport system substrate-binding protein